MMTNHVFGGHSAISDNEFALGCCRVNFPKCNKAVKLPFTLSIQDRLPQSWEIAYIVQNNNNIKLHFFMWRNQKLIMVAKLQLENCLFSEQSDQFSEMYRLWSIVIT